MAERSLEVVVLEGVVYVRTTRYGGSTCYQQLIEGPQWMLDQTLEEVRCDDEGYGGSHQNQWCTYADGGYLVDFDRKIVLVRSWAEGFQADLPVLKDAWPGWTLQVSKDLPEDFHLYLESRGILRSFENQAACFRGDVMDLMLRQYPLEEARHVLTKVADESLQFVTETMKLCLWLPFQSLEQRTDHPLIDVNLLLDPLQRDRITLDGLTSLRDKPVFHWLEPIVRAGEVPNQYEAPKRISLGLVVAIAMTGELSHLYGGSDAGAESPKTSES